MNVNFDPDDPLRRLSDQLADGLEIAWENEELAHPDAAGKLHALRLIETMSIAHQAQRDASQASREEEELFRWGPLSVHELVARGSFAEVYRAYDPRLQRVVALKLLDPEPDAMSHLRWIEEARRMARVRHPNVLLVYDSATFDGHAGIWTEYLDGRTLEVTVREDGVLGAREAILVGMELCLALSAVHAAGLIHGDVKAANVMREQGGRIVLMDFGSGRSVDADGSGAPTGSPLYCAPEVLGGDPPSPRSDVYSLGVLLYWLVSGEFPFWATSVEGLRQAQANASAVDLRKHRLDLPRAFVAVIERAISVDASRRFEDCAQFERALADCLSSGRKAVTQRRRITPFLAVTAALAVCLLGWVAWQSRSPSSARSFERLYATGADLNVSAQMLHVVDGARRLLPAGAAVTTGERLELSIQTDVDANVYVLNEDLNGELFVLFPVVGMPLQNPLAGGQAHLLPGPLNGREQQWIVTSAGGSERFLTIASRTPLPDLEERIGRWNQARRDRPLATPTGELRGVGGMDDAIGPDLSASALQELANELQRASQDPDGLWMRVTLHPNPRPE